MQMLQVKETQAQAIFEHGQPLLCSLKCGDVSVNAKHSHLDLSSEGAIMSHTLEIKNHCDYTGPFRKTIQNIVVGLPGDIFITSLYCNIKRKINTTKPLHMN